MKIIDFVLNLLFPPRCAACQKEGDFLCAKCIQSLSLKPITGASPKGEWQHLDGVIYAVDYEKNPAIQASVKQFKYKFTKPLAKKFGMLITEKLLELSMTKNKEVLLIPVPLHKKRLSYRGFNQAEVIAKNIVFPSKILPALRRIKHTSQQAKLHKRERHENLEDAFKLNKKFEHEQKLYSKNSIVFLVDDVCTTGATLENCAKELKASGVPKVYGLVIARQFR